MGRVGYGMAATFLVAAVLIALMVFLALSALGTLLEQLIDVLRALSVR